MGLWMFHAPLAGCDRRNGGLQCQRRHFNPRTPCGVRPCMPTAYVTRRPFQSTHPLRGATLRLSARSPTSANFNPRTPCGVRRYVRGLHAHRPDFNPRTPCGVRRALAAAYAANNSISIHAPLAGCDYIEGVTIAPESLFQSTHPLRGATAMGAVSPGGQGISIHAPLAGCDDV